MIEAEIFSGAWNLVVFASAALLLPWWHQQSNFNIFGIALVFLAWDLAFILDPASLADRTPNEILASAHGARNYMYWMFPLYAVVLGSLLALKQEQINTLKSAIRESGLSNWLLVAPLAITMVLLLFVPIQIGNQEPTVALMTHFIVIVFGEQMVVFILAHVILRLVRYVLKSIRSAPG